MILTDSNIIIYAQKREYNSLRAKLSSQSIAVNWIIKVEVLSRRNLIKEHELLFRTFFNQAVTMAQDEEVYEKAIELRKNYKVKLGDAIIAATALCNDIELWTANTEDFKNLKGLKLVNPLAA